MIGLQAIMALCQQFFPELAHILSHLGMFGHGHHHGHGGDLGPNINAAWLAGGSIVIKEWLYRRTMKVAKQKRSSVLASNAYHHRVDSLTAFVALLTITASHFMTNAQWLDPVGGLVISGMIVQAGWVNTKTSLLELADVAMDKDIKEKVQTTAASALKQQIGSSAEIKGVQGVKSGQNFLVEVEVAVPPNWTVARTGEVETALRDNVSANVRGVRRVVVRFTNDKNKEEPFFDEFVAGQVSDSEPEDDGHEHHEHNHGHEHTNGHATEPKAAANESTRKRK